LRSNVAEQFFIVEQDHKLFFYYYSTKRKNSLNVQAQAQALAWELLGLSIYIKL
jgi:hypothetical protein